MAYDWQDYEAEMEAFHERMTAMGVSASTYRGAAIVQTPQLGPYEIHVKRGHIILCGSANYARWRMDVASSRIDARADLDRLLADAWERIGVDEPTAIK